MVTGTVDAKTIKLHLSDTVIVAGLGTVSSCTSDDVFNGEISGNSISGTLSRTSPASAATTARWRPVTRRPAAACSSLCATSSKRFSQDLGGFRPPGS